MAAQVATSQDVPGVPCGGVGTGGEDSTEWLLLHKRDEYAVEGWEPEAHPRSVISGLTNEEIALG